MGMCELLNFGPSHTAANAAFNGGPHTAPDVSRQIQTSKARCLALTARSARRMDLAPYGAALKRLSVTSVVELYTQREKSNIFLSLLTWTPPETSGVSKDGPLSTKLGFGGLVL